MTARQPLKGQKALVTGANSGIGEGVARALAAAGADVVVNYVSRPEDAERLVGELKAAGVDAMAIRADVSREAEVRSMFQEMIAAWGTIDILVSNAGLQRDATLVDMTLEQWNTVLGVNLTGTFLCVREAAREMIRRGPRPTSPGPPARSSASPRSTSAFPGPGTSTTRRPRAA